MTYGLRRRALAFAAGGALCLCAGLGMAQQPAPAGNAAAADQVTIDNFAFAPATITVKPGTAVVWINKDEEPHTVMSTDKEQPFRSPALDTNDKFQFVFSKPGTYKYFCSIHSHMTGTVIVK